MTRRYDLFIVGAGLLAAVGVGIAILWRFSQAQEVVQVAAVMLSAITAIVSAAFGIAQTQVASDAQQAAAVAEQERQAAQERLRARERALASARAAAGALRRDYQALATRAAAGDEPGLAHDGSGKIEASLARLEAALQSDS